MKAPSLLLCSGLAILPAACDKKDDPKVVVVDGASGKAEVVDAKNVIVPALEATIKGQVDALNREDIEGYMRFVHPDATSYSGTRAALEKQFVDFDLKTTVEKIQPITTVDGMAEVRVTLKTEKLSGGPFRDNRVTSLYMMGKDGSMWKITANAEDSREYLDGKE